MRVLIDTCIIIDAIQSREPFKDDAQKIFLHVANRTFDGFITAKSVADIYYLTHRHTHCDEDTRKVLSKLFTLFGILDTTGLDCRKAISSEMSDYEDAIMVETAINNDIDCIVTRNTKDYSKASIAIHAPDEFLKIIKPETE